MRDTKEQQIAGLAPFTGCTPHDVRWIASHADMLYVGARTELAIAGEPVREFMVIVDGAASADSVVFGPGAYIGDLGTSRHARSIETITDVKVLVFGLREFRGLLQRVPSVAKTMMRDIVVQLRDQDERNLRAVS